MRQQLGITVMPEYAQTEGVERVLDNIVDLAEAGGARLLDRPLWGRRELFVHTAPSFVPTASLYAGYYQPPPANALSREQGPVVARLIEAAKRRGLSVYLQVMAAAPPGYRVQFGAAADADRMRLPDGHTAEGRVDGNISLAAADLRVYMRGLLRDLCRHYPQVDGFKFDWPEIPPYHFRSLWFDFNPQARAVGRAAGIDVERLRAGLETLCRDPRGALAGHRPFDDGETPTLERLLGRSPLLAELAYYRESLVLDYLEFLRHEVDSASAGGKQIFLQSFPYPWNILSGFNTARAAAFADQLGVKIYTMHWPMMERDYAAALGAQCGLPEALAVRAVRDLLQTTRHPVTALDELRYPTPEQPHPADDALIEDKLRRARRAAGATPLWGLSHGYGPLDDVGRRFDAVLRGAEGRVYVNRYGYLDDAKLALIGERLRAFASRNGPDGGAG